MHDLFSLDLIINLESEKVSGCSQLELSDAVLLVLLDSDLLGTWEILLLSSHDLDEFLQVLNFLGLHSMISLRTYHFIVPLIYIINSNPYQPYFKYLNNLYSTIIMLKL